MQVDRLYLDQHKLINMYISEYQGTSQYPQETDYSHSYSFIQLFNIAFSSVFCDLENDVKVKLVIWHKGLSKDNHLAL